MLLDHVLSLPFLSKKNLQRLQTHSLSRQTFLRVTNNTREMNHIWCLLFILFFRTNGMSSSSFGNHKLYELQRKLQERTLTVPTASHDLKNEGRVFYPIGYGADPTGAQDSTDALLSAVRDAVSVQNNGHTLLSGIKDLGGVVIDLQGGNYMISKPITFPSHIGNVLVQGGSIRASGTFPGNRHLIELWAPNSQSLSSTDGDFLKDQKDQNAAIFYEAITFRDILFDSSYRGGGLFVIDSARIRVNNCFFLHFSTDGILVQRGHETFVSSCFLGQRSTTGGDRGERGFTGTAIDLASNDNAITDVAIFSAMTGIILRGEANIITGVHCYNKATFFGGIGILVKAGKTRIDNCYLDYNAIVIEDPSQVHVANGFFLGDGNIVLKAINGKVHGLTVVNNMFSGDPKRMAPIVKIEGLFRNIDQVVIERNNVDGMSLRSTVGKKAVGGNGTKWIADFSSDLVFPNRISHVQYSVYVPVSRVFFSHAVTNVSSNVVIVESDKVANAVVSVEVDQYNMAGENRLFM